MLSLTINALITVGPRNKIESEKSHRKLLYNESESNETVEKRMFEPRKENKSKEKKRKEDMEKAKLQLESGAPIDKVVKVMGCSSRVYLKISSVWTL